MSVDVERCRGCKAKLLEILECSLSVHDEWLMFCFKLHYLRSIHGASLRCWDAGTPVCTECFTYIYIYNTNKQKYYDLQHTRELISAQNT